MTTVTEAVDQRAATPSPREVLRTLLDRNASAVGQSLPSGFDRERFVRLLLTAANTNPELFECDPRSFLAAGVAAAQLGLEPNDPRGLAYLVPFRDRRRGKVVQLIVGYKGMLDLARRSGMVTAIHAFAVFDGDAFTYRLGLDPTLDHVPHPDGDDDPLKLTYVYAVAAIGGDKQFVVMSRRQIDRVKAQYARSEQSPWHTHYVEMALKTSLRRLCKWLPQTVEMARAIDVEDHGLVVGDLAMPGTVEGHSIDPAGEVEAIEAGVAADVEPAATTSSEDGGGDGSSPPHVPAAATSDTAVSDSGGSASTPHTGGRRRGSSDAATPSDDETGET